MLISRSKALQIKFANDIDAMTQLRDGSLDAARRLIAGSEDYEDVREVLRAIGICTMITLKATGGKKLEKEVDP